MKTRKTTKKYKTETDGTRVVDLQAWQRDAYGAYARREISFEQYKQTVEELRLRIDALIK